MSSQREIDFVDFKKSLFICNMTHERALLVEDVNMSMGTQQDKQHILNLNQVFYVAPKTFKTLIKYFMLH